MSLDSKAINITIPKELLSRVDQVARKEYMSRSDYIRSALVERLQKTMADDDGWRTVVDFTEISEDGVPAADVLESLEKLQQRKRVR